MSKLVLVFLLVLASMSFAAYSIGDVCENIEWTTEDGETTSIYEQVDQGKAVMIFWGQTW